MLDRCPFCGGVPANHYRSHASVQVLCLHCCAKGPAAPTIEKAIELWNRRTLGRAEVEK